MVVDILVGKSYWRLVEEEDGRTRLVLPRSDDDEVDATLFSFVAVHPVDGGEFGMACQLNGKVEEIPDVMRESCEKAIEQFLVDNPDGCPPAEEDA